MQVRDLNGTRPAVIRPASGGFPRHGHDGCAIAPGRCLGQGSARPRPPE
ncbi:hypothetical protein [Nonomuraea sp. NPDC005650]